MANTLLSGGAQASTNKKRESISRRVLRRLKCVLGITSDPAALPDASSCLSTVPQTFMYLHPTHVDPLNSRIDEISRNPGEKGVQNIIIYGDGEPCKIQGCAVTFDSAADINLIDESVLKKLRKKFVMAENMPAEQREQMEMAQASGKFKAIGMVPLMWYFEDIRSVPFTMPFFVVPEECERTWEMIIGKYYIDATDGEIKKWKTHHDKGSKFPHRLNSIQFSKQVTRLFPKRPQSHINSLTRHHPSSSQSSLWK